jgi:hypothetical protein
MAPIPMATDGQKVTGRPDSCMSAASFHNCPPVIWLSAFWRSVATDRGKLGRAKTLPSVPCIGIDDIPGNQLARRPFVIALAAMKFRRVNSADHPLVLRITE